MAVEAAEKVSGSPGQGPVLDEAALKEFAGAIEKDGAVNSETPEAAPAAEPAAEPAPEAAAPPAAEPQVPADWKAPSYQEHQAILAKQAEYERQIAQVQADHDKRANEIARERLIRVAEQHPELRAVIYGEEPTRIPARAPSPAPAPAPKSPTSPNAADPTAARIEALEKSNAFVLDSLKAEQAARQQRERVETLDRIQEQAETQMEKHPILRKGSPMYETGCELVAHLLSREPKTPIEAIVDRVGNHLKERVEKIKAEYVKTKVADSTKVRPGAGGGPPVPPGAAPAGKLKLSDGSVGRAFGRALEAQARQAAQ